ncbi:MFS transporter [Pseudomonas sp. LS1212]|uniref:MFS transporter n=1 Tax=Pseudomonas sp. LS1212 TaxID=2972478 RepID=UPI00215CC6D6|nr:MFS transporter [Pseudomonas sp. LS1212]UVJ43504.1 MFS transporter [Pseudomonas sp. LS1212]
MTRPQIRRRLAVAWWLQLVLALLPLLVMGWIFGDNKPLWPILVMPCFIVGVASMFISLPRFRAYKHTLIATQKALDTPEEPGAWNALAQTRRVALHMASLPAWIAALAVPIGLEAVPLILLAISSVVLLYLYRIPRQLG